MTKYHKIMEHVSVDDEMKEEILQNLHTASFRPLRSRILLRKMVLFACAAIACLAGIFYLLPSMKMNHYDSSASGVCDSVTMDTAPVLEEAEEDEAFIESDSLAADAGVQAEEQKTSVEANTEFFQILLGGDAWQISQQVDSEIRQQTWQTKTNAAVLDIWPLDEDLGKSSLQETAERVVPQIRSEISAYSSHIWNGQEALWQIGQDGSEQILWMASGNLYILDLASPIDWSVFEQAVTVLRGTY